MRIGLQLRPGHEREDGRVAERAACAFVGIAGDARSPVVAAAAAVVATDLVRIVVPIRLGADHPVTLAEDVAVLDNLSGGRIVVLVDTGSLSAEEASEDLALFRASLGSRPVQHRGVRWQVPANLEGHEAPDSIQVTPKPVQISIPLWLSSSVAPGVHVAGGPLPVLATSMAEVDPSVDVQPAVLEVGGTEATLDADRDAVIALADVGATHLLLRVADPSAAAPLVARFLIPEVAMTGFPRVVAEAMLPPIWPGPARYVSAPRADKDGLEEGGR